MRGESTSGLVRRANGEGLSVLGKRVREPDVDESPLSVLDQSARGALH